MSELRFAPTLAERQTTPKIPYGKVPWEVHLEAHAVYKQLTGGQSAERIAERGGFGYRELQCLLAGHYYECPDNHNHPPVPGWEER